jgi:hypothetical protein
MIVFLFLVCLSEYYDRNSSCSVRNHTLKQICVVSLNTNNPASASSSSHVEQGYGSVTPRSKVFSTEVRAFAGVQGSVQLPHTSYSLARAHQHSLKQILLLLNRSLGLYGCLIGLFCSLIGLFCSLIGPLASLELDPSRIHKKRNAAAPAPPLLSRTPVCPACICDLNSEPSSAISPCFSETVSKETY